MPVVPADSVQVSHIKETVTGVTPTTPAMELWRLTGETLTFSPETSESAELGSSGRSVNPSNVVGMTVAGDISFELAKFPALDEAIAAVLAGTWGECPLTGAPGGGVDNANRVTIGTTLQSFTVEKRFQNVNNVAGTYDLDCTESGAPGASVVLTVTGGPTTGSGVMVLDIYVDTVRRRVFASYPAGVADATAAGAILTAALNDDGTVTATDNLDGTVTIVPTTGTQIDSVTIRSGADQYYYQRYVGCTYSALNLSISPNSSITGSVSIVGGIPDMDELPLTGVTYVDSGDSAVFTAPEVVAITIGTLFSVGTHCWSSLDLTYDSANRGIACIGSVGEREVVLGTMSVSMSGDVFFINQDVLYALLRNETIGDGYVTLTNADDDVYRFDLFGLKPVSGELAAGGTGEDLTIPLELQPTPTVVCDDGGSAQWKASSIVSTIDLVPPIP